MSDAKDRASLEILVRKHRNLSGKIKVLDNMKKRVTSACKDVMARLGAREVLVDDKGTPLKATFYAIDKVEWDLPKLARLGNDKEVRVVKVVLDEEAIEAAVLQGKLTLEDVHKCGKVERTYGFRVDVVRDES